MSEITKQLFNQNFHSDVQFSVGGKIIYAHSLELMKRSVVFEEKLEGTLGDKKLIPIVDCKYENFLEFIRFIYTDECEFTEDNGIEILKLATHYKVISLENKVINSLVSEEWRLKLFEHCIVDKYELVRNIMHVDAAIWFGQYIKHNLFLSLHPDFVEALLNFDYISNDVTEAQIFTALHNWVTSYCKAHQMPLSEGRQQFDKLIRKIRFPAMSKKEIRECTKSGLLSKNDYMSIGQQIVFGDDNECENNLWISKCRDVFIVPYVCDLVNNCGNIFETRLSVSKETIFHGIRIGDRCRNRPVQVEISTEERCEKLTFKLAGSNWWNLTINLGESLLLKSNCEYTIMIKYLDVLNSNLNVWCRKQCVDAIIHDVTKSVRIIQISRNVIEMFFKSPTN